MLDFSSYGFDTYLRRITSLLSTRRARISALTQNMMVEQSPYAPSTFISKGTLAIEGATSGTITGVSVGSITQTGGTIASAIIGTSSIVRGTIGTASIIGGTASNMTIDTPTIAGTIFIGADCNFFRQGANELRTDDTFICGEDLIAVGAPLSLRIYNGSGQLVFGDGAGGYDTNLYRSGAGTLKTDDKINSVIGYETNGTAGIGTVATILDRNGTIGTITHTMTFLGGILIGYATA